MCSSSYSGSTRACCHSHPEQSQALVRAKGAAGAAKALGRGVGAREEEPGRRHADPEPRKDAPGTVRRYGLHRSPYHKMGLCSLLQNTVARHASRHRRAIEVPVPTSFVPACVILLRSSTRCENLGIEQFLVLASVGSTSVKLSGSFIARGRCLVGIALFYSYARSTYASTAGEETCFNCFFDRGRPR